MRHLAAIARIAVTAFAVATVVYAFRSKQPSGRFLGAPYEFRVPTAARLRERLWNPDDPRILTPPVFGVGWSVNLCHLAAGARRLLAGAQRSGGES